jgi:hypothetical protein
MTDIDISKIKPGDIVTVRAKCTALGDYTIVLEDTEGDSFCVPVHTIICHEPEPLKIGDVVIYHDSSKPCSIIGLYGDKAWLEYLGETWCVVNVSHLKKVKQP